jgi:hypothetical protein
MPEGFPTPAGLSQEEITRSDEWCEDLWGPVVAAFTPGAVTSGGHPEEVVRAWTGIRLPVRELLLERMQDHKKVEIDAGEGFNALVAADTDTSVLQYWIDVLPGYPTDTFAFDPSEGDLELI